VQCQKLNRRNTAEQVLRDEEEKQKEAENGLAQEKENTQEDDNGQKPDTLQAPQMEEKEPSITDGQLLYRRAEEVRHCTMHCDYGCNWLRGYNTVMMGNG
jgi:hypothetical protein